MDKIPGRFKDYGQVTLYLLASGVLGYLSAYVAGNDTLTILFAPAINFVLYALVQELKGLGYAKEV